MNKNLSTVLIIIVLALAAGGAFVLYQRATDSTDKAVDTNTSRQEGAEQLPSQSSSNNAGSSASQTNEVAIEDFAFNPATITVKKGTTVKWTNKDTAQHNVVSSQSGGPNGPLLKKGENYSFTFNTTGTFDYICEPHPNMKAKVIVTE